jgi:hypothetical protein
MIYTTPWSEGEVVASVHDSKFAIGCDQCTGGVIYRLLENLMKIEGLNLKLVSDVFIAARCDSARYPRMHTDEEESALYSMALREADFIMADYIDWD